MPVSLTREEAYAFLRSRPSKLVITTIGANGYPHSVPTDYIVIEEDIYVVGRAKAQRVKNVGRNPHVSAVVDSGNTRQTFKGLLIQGDAAIINDAQTVLGILQEVARHGAPLKMSSPRKLGQGSSTSE
jgi:nitroimidazol reductase NimA-like FMN-containing flavoprotein (pyridoxamine 5'-phosphate oxidase superfamily)